MRHTNWTTWLGTGAAILAAAACTDGNPATAGLAFSTRATPGTPAVAQQGDSTVVVRGNDTIIIRTAEVVLREVELKRLNDLAGCDDSSSGTDNDACEEFSTRTQLVSLPLGDQTDKVITVSVPADVYDQVEFRIHKPEDDGSEAAFLAAHPDFTRLSMRVTGTYSQGGTRSDFVYTTDLNGRQEIHLNPPLDVTADGPVNLTIRLDLGTWFTTAGGTALVDPASANKGGQNENLVTNNIVASIRAFHDDDSDGLDDNHEDDDGGSSHDSP